MSVAALVFLVAAAAYLGFQWTIRLLVYPQFAAVGAGEFVAYEQRHQRLVSIVVGPLFTALGVSSLAVLLRHPRGAPMAAVVAAPVSVGLVLLVTGLLAVPLHRRLGGGFDPATHRRLLAVDTVRLVLAVAAATDAVLLVLA